jgi:hypothetical protein
MRIQCIMIHCILILHVILSDLPEKTNLLEKAVVLDVRETLYSRLQNLLSTALTNEP